MAQGTIDSLQAAKAASADSGGMYTWTGPDGYVWNIYGDKALPSNGQGYTQESASMLQQAGVTVGTQADLENAMDPNGKGNGEGGSDWANILTGVTFVVGGAAGLGAFGAESAMVKAATTAINLANGGSPLGAIISYAAPAFTGGEGLDISGGLDGPAGEGLLNTVGTGDPYTLASASDTLSDAAPAGVLQNNDGSFGSTVANSGQGGEGIAAAEGASQGNTPWTGSTAGGGGLLDGMPDWFKNLDPKVQQAMMVAGGGLAAGALSGVGNYAATKAKVEADKLLSDRVSQNRINETTAIRNANQPGLLNMAPSTAGLVLRRSNGTAYYS